MNGIKESDFVENTAIIEEEKNGSARTFIVRHRTTITDAALLDSIKRMSILEVVS